VLAAYGLLTLAESSIPLQPMIVSQDWRMDDRKPPGSPPLSPWLQPSSPRILAS